MKVFHGKKSESNDQNHHAHSAQEHGNIEHFVGTVREKSEIKHAEEQGKTSHTAGNEKAKRQRCHRNHQKQMKAPAR